MAGSAILKIDVLADATKAVAGLKSVGTAAKQQTSTVTSFGSKSKTAFKGVTTSMAGMALGGVGVATAITAVGSALVDASKAAMEDEKSQALLAKSMENNLNATDAQIKSMEDFIDKTARATGVADDQLRPALNNLIIAGQSAAEAQDTLGVAMDIAAAKGLDVETVTKALAKAYDGNVAGLARLGVEVRDADGDLVSFEKAMANVAETMGGSAAVAAATLEGKLARAKVAVDEAKESVGGFVNVQLAQMISGMELLGAIVSTTDKGNKLFAIGVAEMAEQADETTTNVGLLTGGLIFAAEHGLRPTTKALIAQTKAMGFTEQQTRDLTKNIDWMVDTEQISQETADLLTDALDTQADAMASAREAGSLLSGRYDYLADDADDAATAAEGYRKELKKQADQIKALTDPVFALRQAQRSYNTAFKTWSDLAVSGTATADELAAAEDDLTEAGIDLSDAELTVQKSAGKMEDAWNAARAEAGLLTDGTLKSKEAIDQWSAAVNNAPRWHPGTGSGAGPTPLQAGGPVQAGGFYTVGEAGRELFLPGVSGMIVPHGRTEQMLKRSPAGGAGGGGTYTLNMYPRKADPADVAWGFRRLELARTGR